MSVDTTNTVKLAEELSAAPVVNTAKRDVKSQVKLRDAAPHPTRPEGGSIVLKLSVHHDKDSKVFRTNVHISEDEPRGGYFEVSHWEPMNRAHNLRLAPIPCARYSEKALRAAWHDAVATLKANHHALGDLDLSTDGVSR